LGRGECGGERKKGWGAEEQRSRGAEERRKKKELIMFGYKAQEIPPKISPHPECGKRGEKRESQESVYLKYRKILFSPHLPHLPHSSSVQGLSLNKRAIPFQASGLICR